MNVEWALTEKSVFVQLRDIGGGWARERGVKKSASRDGLSHNNNFTNNLILLLSATAHSLPRPQRLETHLIYEVRRWLNGKTLWAYREKTADNLHWGLAYLGKKQ